ncbi:MAG TPA: long-chain fatty acid--CoA ligase [Syntrophomonadaceae bacterium]|nr:long-chain fatty acid--CoA ligase [Syntrophomonadaceae bacterium]
MSKIIPNHAPDWDKRMAAYFEKNKTLANAMLQRSEEFAGHEALTGKVNGEWVSLKWEEVGEQISAVGKALLEMDILDVGEMAGVFAANCIEWAIADLGILTNRGVSVPIYATNSVDEAEYIINDAKIKIIFVGNQEHYDKAKEIIATNIYLKKIIVFEPETKITGDDSMYFQDFLDMGRKAPQDENLKKRLDDAKTDDILTLIYTSGTTGPPKGAIHTHRSFMSGLYPGQTRFPHAGIGHTSLAILPLSHVFERMWSYGCMTVGIRLAYCSDPKDFLDVMVEIKPHFMTSVPRIWEKVYGTIQEGLKTGPVLKSKLFIWAERVALEVYRNKMAGKKSGSFLLAQHSLADKLIMQKVRETLGTENCDLYHVGGAAFSSDVNEFFLAFGINIAQGYGLTEFFPVCIGYSDNARIGKCGPTAPMCEFRLSDEDEIQIKGGMCMIGYHNNPEATAECFTSDGWFKTQDVGVIDVEEKDGDTLTYITITDRIKDLIITAGGKNISPQQIEMLFGEELFIEQFVTIGEGKKFISALVVPNFAVLEDYCQKNNIEFKSREDLISKPEVIKLYDEIIEQRTESLGRVEKIKKYAFLTDELTQESGELTPTMKLKRKQIDENYKDIIDEMYAD